MFKKDKDLAEKGRALLKNKEVRNLRSTIINQCHSVNEEEVSKLISNKAQVEQIKLSNKTLIYSVDNLAIFFDLEGRNNLYPTLHTLWLIPNAIKSVIIHDPVSEYILRGADLMLPGIIAISSPLILEKEKVAIRIAGNPLPFAVGECTLTLSESLIDSANKKGKAVSIIHFYGDLLANTVTPNSGFGGSAIYPIAPEMTSVTSAVEKDAIKGPSSEADPIIDSEANVETQIYDSQNKDEFIQSTDKEDEKLMLCLLLALKYIIKDKQLPMLASTFWATVQRCSVDNSEIQIKATSFKKESNLLKYCSDDCKLLTTREENGVTLVSSVQRSHDLFKGAKVDDPEAFKASIAGKDKQSAESGIVGSSGAAGGKVAVVELLKLPKAMKDIFGAVRGEYGECLRPSEVRDVLVMFIKSRQLEYESDKTMVRVTRSTPLYALISKSSSAVALTETESQAAAAEISITEVNEQLQQNEIAINDDEGAPLDGGVNDVHGDDNEDDINENYRDEIDELLEESENEHIDEEWMNALSLSKLRNNGELSSVAEILTGLSQPVDVQLKIHKDGLRPLDDLDGDDGFHSKLPSSTIAKPPLPPDRQDEGKKSGNWRPVSLPSPSAVSITSGKVALADKSLSERIRIGREEKLKRKALGVKKGDPGSAAAASLVGQSSVEGDALLISKGELFKLVMNKMTPYFAVLTPSGNYSVHSGQLPKVRIIVETRMGNKSVTLVRSLEVFELDLASLAKDCQKRFACSVSVSAVPGVPQDKEVVVQGNCGSELEDLLHKKWGIPKHLIEVSTGKGVKAKKK